MSDPKKFDDGSDDNILSFGEKPKSLTPRGGSDSLEAIEEEVLQPPTPPESLKAENEPPVKPEPPKFDTPNLKSPTENKIDEMLADVPEPPDPTWQGAPPSGESEPIDVETEVGKQDQNINDGQLASDGVKKRKIIEPDPIGKPNEPASRRDGDPLKGVDISSRQGNYIFTFGKPGSGKTVMQSSILRYLMTSREYNVKTPKPVGDESGNDIAKEEIFLEWRQGWKDNVLPERTAFGRPSEFRYNVAPKTRPDVQLDFGFFEISGEDLQKTRRVKGGKPTLNKSIHDFLANESCEFQFLLVCNGKDVTDDDQLFCDFLHYMREQIGEHFWERSHICIVVSNPIAALKLLKDARPDLDYLEILDIETFLAEFLELTYGELENWQKPFGAAQFHIGNVYRDAENTDIKRIDSFDPEDSRMLFELIYENFTGLPVRPDPDAEMGPVQKFLKWLSQR